MPSARKSTIILSSIMLFLVIASLVSTWLSSQTMPYYWVEKVRHSYVRLFDVNREANIPTWFSSTILLLSALLLAQIYCQKKDARDRYALHWAALALIFTGFSLDETAVLHEMTIIPLRAMFHLTGLFTYGWILIGIASVVVAAIAFYKFLFSLPGRIRHLFLAAATLFIGGGLVVESITGLFTDRNGHETRLCLLICNLEEFLEMLGVIVFIHALLSYLAIMSKETDGEP